jgi:hypothetical protein
MLSRDDIGCFSLRQRPLTAANSRGPSCEIRYKPVGFGWSRC